MRGSVITAPVLVREVLVDVMSKKTRSIVHPVDGGGARRPNSLRSPPSEVLRGTLRGEDLREHSLW